MTIPATAPDPIPPFSLEVVPSSPLSAPARVTFDPGTPLEATTRPVPVGFEVGETVLAGMLLSVSESAVWQDNDLLQLALFSLILV